MKDLSCKFSEVCESYEPKPTDKKCPELLGYVHCEYAHSIILKGEEE